MGGLILFFKTCNKGIMSKHKIEFLADMSTYAFKLLANVIGFQVINFIVF